MDPSSAPRSLPAVSCHRRQHPPAGRPPEGQLMLEAESSSRAPRHFQGPTCWMFSKPTSLLGTQTGRTAPSLGSVREA